MACLNTSCQSKPQNLNQTWLWVDKPSPMMVVAAREEEEWQKVGVEEEREKGDLYLSTNTGY